MTSKLTAADVEAQARKLLDQRMESVRSLVEAQNQIDELNAQLASAQDAHFKAFTLACKSGWSPEELTSLGISEPTKTRARRAPAKPRKSVPRSASRPISDAPESVDVREPVPST